MITVIFETMSEIHRKDIMDIYNYYAENSMSAYPEKKLPYEAYDRFLDITKGYPAYAIMCEGKTAGFCFIRPYNSFPAFKQTVEITYFIHKDFTGKRIGKIALDKIEKDAVSMGITNIMASITSENINSLRFHKKNGFTETGRFKGIGKKFGRCFDIVWMQRTINDSHEI